MCHCLWPHVLQHARLPCPSLSSGVCSNSSPLSQWCYLIMSSSAPPSLLLPSIFLSIRVFSVSCFFGSDGWNIGASASASVLPMNIQDWFPLRLTGWTWLRDWTEPISFWTCWTWVSVPICVLVENFLQVFTLQYLQNILATYPDK